MSLWTGVDFEMYFLHLWNWIELRFVFKYLGVFSKWIELRFGLGAAPDFNPDKKKKSAEIVYETLSRVKTCLF